MDFSCADVLRRRADAEGNEYCDELLATSHFNHKNTTRSTVCELPIKAAYRQNVNSARAGFPRVLERSLSQGRVHRRGSINVLGDPCL
jgi:hypothetical protein